MACQSELDEKVRKHKCRKSNRRAARTEELRQSNIKRNVHDTVVNRIEQHNFDRLVRQGIFVKV